MHGKAKAMNVIREGMEVVCRHPVNGLYYGGRYRVKAILSDDMFYQAPPLVVQPIDVPGPTSPDGYFPWRFSPIAVVVR